MKKKEKGYVTFQIGDEILTVQDGNVLIKGFLLIGNDNERCCLSIPRPVFMKTMKKFLDLKATFWKNWKEFCGHEFISSEDFKQAGVVWLNEWNEEKEEMIKITDVKKFQVNSLEIEMEHG